MSKSRSVTKAQDGKQRHSKQKEYMDLLPEGFDVDDIAIETVLKRRTVNGLEATLFSLEATLEIPEMAIRDFPEDFAFKDNEDDPSEPYKILLGHAAGYVFSPSGLPDAEIRLTDIEDAFEDVGVNITGWFWSHRRLSLYNDEYARCTHTL